MLSTFSAHYVSNDVSVNLVVREIEPSETLTYPLIGVTGSIVLLTKRMGNAVLLLDGGRGPVPICQRLEVGKCESHVSVPGKLPFLGRSRSKDLQRTPSALFGHTSPKYLLWPSRNLT
jgi:hypothetical protein